MTTAMLLLFAFSIILSSVDGFLLDNSPNIGCQITYPNFMKKKNSTTGIRTATTANK